MDRYLRGPTPAKSSSLYSANHRNIADDVLTEDAIMAVSHEVESWSSSRHNVSIS